MDHASIMGFKLVILVSKYSGKVLMKARASKVQLRTNKVNKLKISGTRFFSDNLTTDLNSDKRRSTFTKRSRLAYFSKLFWAAPIYWSIIFLKKGLADKLAPADRFSEHTYAVPVNCLRVFWEARKIYQ